MKPELGLFAVFYDGETRPVAGFVLEQDAVTFAKKYSDESSIYEIKKVHVVSALEQAVVEKSIARNTLKNKAHLEGSLGWHAQTLIEMDDELSRATDRLIAAREPNTEETK